MAERRRACFREYVAQTFGVGGQVCADGHLHFHPVHGLVEWVDPDTHLPIGSDGIGTLVITPLPPFRETTLLLRYDTQDLVRVIAEPPKYGALWHVGTG